MLRTRNDQLALWDAILPEELLALPELLAKVDELLDDGRFFAPFREHFHPAEGRPSIPIETYLRMMLIAPVVYDYAYTMVEGRTPADMPDVLHETFTKSVAEARANPPELVGPGYYAPMRLDDFVESRVVEAVAHGLDLTDALGRGPAATPDGIAITAAILDQLLARRPWLDGPPT
jgi:hypothetical protein